MLYAHKKHLVSVVRLPKVPELYTFGGLQIGYPDDYLAIDQDGNKRIITKDEFEAEWESVEKVDLKEKMKQGYKEMYDMSLEEANAGNYTYFEGLFTDKPF